MRCQSIFRWRCGFIVVRSIVDDLLDLSGRFADIKLTMPIRIRLLALLGFFFACLGGVAHADMEVLELKYRNAEQVLPVLQPLVEAGGAISGTRNQIILRASRRNIDEIRRVLAKIDSPPRRLTISVRQDSAENVQGVAAGVEGSIHSRGGGELRANVVGSRNSRDERVSQRVQVLEGYAATILVGQSVPVPTRSISGAVTGANQGVLTAETITYRDINTGFDVVPRLTGEMVQLEISPRREARDSRDNRDTRDMLGNSAAVTVNTQRIATTAGGRLGEWFELGGVSQEASRQGAGQVHSSRGERRDTRRVWVKVEEIK